MHRQLPGGQHRPGRGTAGRRLPPRHPRVEVRVRETDLTDPTCGLRAGSVDVALTRGPFDHTGPVVRELRTDPLAALLRTDDPLAPATARSRPTWPTDAPLRSPRRTVEDAHLRSTAVDVSWNGPQVNDPYESTCQGYNKPVPGTA
ncbi:LysR substrate-binding domain-containing protein [Actinomadura sp. NPDC047616]|uniref:LysR substrate-binding domain-containing protein n=1 Tax=Actinomadura sp. NPDC047616 TaxID=3155914 RepID=UPI0033C77575